MARRGHAYPQAEVRAAELIDAPVVTCAPSATVREAHQALAAEHAALGELSGRGVVLRDDLARAIALGLEGVAARDLAWPVPVVADDASEVAVRRRFRAGARAVLVTREGSPRGAITLSAPAQVQEGVSIRRELAQSLGADVLRLLGEIGETARARGAAAFAVGGVIRDALLVPGAAPTPSRDLDVTIEGDAAHVARACAERLGGRVLVHETFGTAVWEGSPAGRVDFATARTESYASPGVLPTVRAATLAADLARRDFTVNALAAELGSGAFHLVDPLGGRLDLQARRLRVLHPLSFVEDPTRMFRAARYETRLGLRLDPAGRRARALALRFGAFAAVSSARLAAEIDRSLRDPRPGETLRAAGRAGVFRLLHPRFRHGAHTDAALTRLSSGVEWIARHGLRVRAIELAALAIAAGQTVSVARGVLDRLGLTGAAGHALLDARADAPGLVADVTQAPSGPASERARRLRARAEVLLAWSWLIGPSAARDELEWWVTQAADIRSSLRGDDLLALGVPAGAEIGRTLERLRDARLDGLAQGRDDEIARVRCWLAAKRTEPTIGREG